MAANPFLEAGIIRNVQNEQTTRFWMDKWLVPILLRHFLSAPLSLPILYATVTKYWVKGRGWKWDQLQDLLLEDILRRLAGFMPSSVNTIEDDIGWGLDTTGVFSLATAYDVIAPSLTLGDSTD